MNRRRLRLVTALLIACVAVLLWQDCARFIRSRAERRYRANDYAAARDAWQLALKLRGGDLVSRFNHGVALYRMGDYTAALADFSAAGASSDPLLRCWALYNQGNSLVRLAGQSSASNATAADNLYRAALERYRQVLTLRPEDPDTKANLAMASAARTALLVARGNRPPDAKRLAAESPAGAAASGQKQAGDRIGQSATEGGNRGQATNDDQSNNGRRRKTMGREQAERLLNEKRGQEALPSAILATPGGKGAAPPLKDW